MEKLITAKDIAARYSCSLPTARKYLRNMFHYEKPLTAPAWAVKEWERNREQMPDGISRRRTAEISRKKDRAIVPRKR